MKELFGLIYTNYEGTEFGPLTEDRPVASLPFGGRYRLVDFPLSNMVNSGINNVGVITPYMYRSLMDHISGGKSWGLGGKTNGLYVLPGTVYGRRTSNNKLTLRDLLNNTSFLNRCGDARLVITSSSRIMNIDYTQVSTFHEHIGADITLVYKKDFATPNDPDSPALELAEDGRVIGISASGGKPCNNYLQCIVMDNALLVNILNWYSAMGHLGMTDVVRENLKQFKVYAYAFDGYVGAVDDLVSFMRCSMDMLREDVSKELYTGERSISTKPQDYPPAKYGKDAKVSNSLIASGCIIEGTVENSIISRSCHIGPGAVIRNSVLMPSVTVGREANLNHVICDKRAAVADFVTMAGTEDAPFAVAKQGVVLNAKR